MRVLLHIGLNKCASTAIQHALDQSRADLAYCGVWYPEQDGPPCQYGLSRAMGFGPDAPAVARQSVGDLIADARRRACTAMILSSEYFSLYRPKAAQQMWRTLAAYGCTTTIVMFSRDLPAWVRSLFNQYVRTVEGGGALSDIDAFVDQVLANGAIDIARRYQQWADVAGVAAIEHFRLPEGIRTVAPLTPFSHFAGTPIAPAPDEARNPSLGPGALYRIGQLRQQPHSTARDREIRALLAGAPAPSSAPPGYLQISAERSRLLEERVGHAYRALPCQMLTTASNGGRYAA